MQEQFEDTKGVIRICKSKDRQHNGEKKKKDNRRNKDLQNATQKTKERATRARTPLKQGVNSGRVNISCFTSGTRRIAQVTNPVISDE